MYIKGLDLNVGNTKVHLEWPIKSIYDEYTLVLMVAIGLYS